MGIAELRLHRVEVEGQILKANGLGPPAQHHVSSTRQRLESPHGQLADPRGWTPRLLGRIVN